MPRREDLDQGLRADPRRAAATQLGVDSAVVVGNSMGGFVAAELALSFSTRVRAARARVSAAGLSIENLRREPLLVGRAGLGRDGGAAGRARALRGHAAADAAASALQLIVRYPERLSPALTYELIRGAGTPGLRARAGGADSLLLPRPALADRGARCWSSGAATTCSCPRGDAREYVRPDRRQRAARDVRGHRPPRDGRAPDTVQPAAGGVRSPASGSPRPASRASAPEGAAAAGELAGRAEDLEQRRDHRLLVVDLVGGQVAAGLDASAARGRGAARRPRRRPRRAPPPAARRRASGRRSRRRWRGTARRRGRSSPAAPAARGPGRPRRAAGPARARRRAAGSRRAGGSPRAAGGRA